MSDPFDLHEPGLGAAPCHGLGGLPRQQIGQRATLAGPATTAAPRTSPAAAGNVSVALLEPGDGDTREGNTTFRWSVTGGAPPAGQSFEVFFYRLGENPLNGGFGLTAPTSGSSATVDLAALDADPNHPLDPGIYLWGVRLVQGGRPVQVAAEGRRLIYQRPQPQQQPEQPAATVTPGCVGVLCP